MEERRETRVECQICGFSRIVSPDDDETPADVIVEHGRETGHTLAIEVLDE